MWISLNLGPHPPACFDVRMRAKRRAGRWVDHNAGMNKAARRAQMNPSLAGLAVAGPGARWWPAAAAGLLWLAAGLSAGYWILLAWGRTPVVPVAASAMPLPTADPQLVARALGSVPAAVAVDPAAPVPSTRYSLVGLVARSPLQGAALISVDGQAPRPYTVGSTVEGGLVLQEVGRESVKLGPSVSEPASVELTLPEVEKSPPVENPPPVEKAQP